MTITLFITLLTVFSAITGIATESIKKVFVKQGKSYSANMIAFFISCIVGIGGTATYYSLTSIPFNSSNIICMVLMGLAVSFGSMVGYDKIIQTINQFKNI